MQSDIYDEILKYMEEHKIEAEAKHFAALSDLSHRILLRLKKLNSLNSEKIWPDEDQVS